jgi:hypothetical protein
MEPFNKNLELLNYECSTDNPFVAFRLFYHSSFVIRHSSFVIRHSSFVIRHSPFVIRHSGFAIRAAKSPRPACAALGLLGFITLPPRC